MIVKRTELLKTLNTIKAGLSSNSYIKQMENVQISGSDFISFNEEICVIAPFETDFEASVNYSDFVQIIAKLDSEDVDLKLDDTQMLITTEHTKAGLLTMDAAEFGEKINTIIEQTPENENDWSDLPQDFTIGVSLCTPAADTDMTKGTMACLSANDTHIICTDNNRVAIFELESPVDAPFFIRAGLISELTKFDAKKYFLSDSWAYFKTDDNIIFATRHVRGNSLEKYLTLLDGFNSDAIELPDGLRDIVSSAAVMADSNDGKPMHVTINKDKMTCTTQNARGWVEKVIPINNTIGADNELYVDAVFLQHVLGLPAIKMFAGDTKTLFTSGKFSYILSHLQNENS